MEEGTARDQREREILRWEKRRGEGSPQRGREWRERKTKKERVTREGGDRGVRDGKAGRSRAGGCWGA